MYGRVQESQLLRHITDMHMRQTVADVDVYKHKETVQALGFICYNV